MNLSPDGKTHVLLKYETTSFEINFYLALSMNTRSSTYLCEIFTSTDNERHRRAQGTEYELPSGILPDPRTSFYILHNSSCFLTN